MEVAEQVTALRLNGALMADAAGAAGPDAPVPTCPEWVVRDLVRHQGGVHRWATGIVAGPRVEPWDVDLDEVVGSWPSDAELVPWLKDGVERLADTLATADPDLVCWTFLAAPSPLAMWARRQAHETAVHRVDAELAAARQPQPAAPTLAADGIDELLTCFITRRRTRLVADPTRTLRVRCTDTDGDWLVRIDPEGVTTDRGPGETDCEVSGDAWSLYLALWNRLDTARLDTTGDGSVLDLFVDSVHVRWS